MGIDVIGWRGCELQRSLGPTSLRRLIKLRQLHRLIAARVPPERRVEVSLTEAAEEEQRTWSWPQLSQAVEPVLDGDPACERCPLADGEAVGCWRPVGPVSEEAERLLFTYFSVQRRNARSIVAALDVDFISQVPRDTPWHTERGAGGLALLPAPLCDGERDSGQLLAALFWRPVEHPALIQGLSAFWEGFERFVAEETAAHMDPSALAQGGQDGEERRDRTVRELLALGSMVQTTARHGWLLR